MFSILLCITLFSVFSTTVMAYVSMATPIGPWMGPILAVMVLLLGKACLKIFTSEAMLLSVIGGSLGGILAIAFGFSFPTFYFLDKAAFMHWIAVPHLFIPAVSLLALSAGALGLWVASISAHQLLEEQKLAFPIGTLMYKITSAVDNKGKLRQLILGFFGTLFYCFSLTIQWFGKCIPATVTVTRAFSLGSISIPSVQCLMGQLPMLWAIGFIAGGMITIPLLIGTLSKIFVIDLINKWHFPTLSSSDFIFAFCSGMVVIGAVATLFTMPAQLMGFFKKFFTKTAVQSGTGFQKKSVFYLLPIVFLVGYTLQSSGFSLLAQLYSIIFSCICAYQIAAIAGKIGLALLGRFATFVMIPGMLIFGLNALQVTVLATFVEACGGIATDALFGRKAGLLAGIDQRKIIRYQIFGLLVCSITLGIVIWFLVTNFQLGSEMLFAERAQVRALLVNAAHFNGYVLICGALYGLLLKHCGVNPMLVMGGLLMPLSLTMGLVLGGVSSLLISKKYDIEPFCSGMFAANSVGMIVQALWFR